MVRVPGWVESGQITIGDKVITLTANQASSYVEVEFDPVTEQITIDFDMPVRFTAAHPLVEECVNQAAVERGPLVYCMETADADVETLDDLLLDLNGEFKTVDYTIKDRTVLSLETEMYIKKNKSDKSKLYQTVKFDGLDKVKVRMIPYFAWDNRSVEDDGTYDVYAIEDKLDTPDDMEYDEMRIWMPIAYK